MSIIQLLLDKRQPFFVPYHFLSAQILKSKIDSISTRPKQIYILLTFDVENRWGDEEQNGRNGNIDFLEKIQCIKQSNKTLFVPGNLVAGLSANLKEIESENEIGLHGHHHELWRSAYFVKKEPVKDMVKQKLVADSLDEFERCGLKRPFSFRAPYMWFKKSDLRLLERMGFIVDSSDLSQSGRYRIRNDGKILRIPVTAGPFPDFIRKRGLVYAKFRLLDMQTLREIQDEAFIEYVDQVISMQSYLKLLPHLVFLAHSWEFYREKDEPIAHNYIHLGEENYEIFRNKFELLEQMYSVKYVTVSEFKAFFENRRNIG
jgi:peptidoglycan/xylan/chitin deacetylase (PgdA/CDA1 family)